MNNVGLPCVAILDDDVALCAFMAEVAQLAGYRAVSASDASQLPQLLQAAPTVLVLDLAMPGTDGIEVMRQLAQQGFAGRLILVSGYDPQVLQAARKLAELQGLQVAGLLTKPIRAEALLALLQAAPVAPVGPSAVLCAVTVAELAHAIDAGELLLLYQPQVRFADGAWVGVEALVRWRHPHHGLLGPQHFIGLAEASGLALPLTLKVLDMALSACAHSALAPGFSGSLSVNLPPAAMTDVGFPDAVLACIMRLGSQATRLQFEITETSVPPDATKVIDILTRLRLKGFTLSIDDFGTGHSSLEQLQRLPVNELKIDLGFVLAATTDPKARAIVEQSIALAGQLGLTVVAEGVENAGLWHWLRQAGCELAQGYLIARPLPLEQLGTWQAEWDSRRQTLFPEQAHPLRTRAGKLRLLLVTDDPATFATTVAQLHALGYGVVTADSAAEALELIEGKHAFAAVLIDLVQPEGMGGAELGRHLRLHCPTLPVLLMTESAEPAQPLASHRLLHKPFAAAVLGPVLAALLAAP